MASAYTGVAVVFGFPGSVAYTGIATGRFIKESGDFESDSQVDELADDDNEIVSLIHSKETFMFSLLFTPRALAAGATSYLNAKESLVAPLPGSRVTLTGFAAPVSPNDLINSATWVYVGGFKLAFKKNGLATYSLKIRRHRTNDLSATATA